MPDTHELARPDDTETLTVQIHIPREVLMPGFAFDLEELIGPVRDAIREQIAAKRAEAQQ